MLRLKLILVCAGGVYLLFTFYATYRLYDSRNRSVQKDDYSRFNEGRTPRNRIHEIKHAGKSLTERTVLVDIWSLTNTGSFLWKEILEGEMAESSDKLSVKGTKIVGRYLFQYHAGKGLSPSFIKTDRDFIVLSLNGRSDETIWQTRMWIDTLQLREWSAKVFLFLIGRENCDNDWIHPYMKSNGGVIDKMFVVYDTNLVNEVDVYQWPLGSALYRGFLGVPSPLLNLDSQRLYVCNFVGTVHTGSSREKLARILEENNLENVCYVNTRNSWPSHEESNSMSKYRSALLQSDLTLCPVGENTECYRIYEACELGSVPVIEDNVVDTKCNVPANPLLLRQASDNSTAVVSVPLRLLKRYNAPFIFVKDWNELPAIIRHELRLFLPDIVERRRRLVQWYEYFKKEIREHFMNVLDDMV